MRKGAGFTATLLLGLAAAIGGCGGGSSNNPAPPPVTPPPPPPPPPPTLDPQYLASAASPFTVGCDGATSPGSVYVNAEVEPSLAIDPLDAQHLIGVWQQDRWSSGGARGLVNGVSHDGGHTWTRSVVPFTRCGGGNAGNGGDHARASNPWMTIAPDGTAHQLALAFDGFALQAGSVSTVLVSRSVDGGASWGPTTVLITDGGAVFDDKGAITADPLDAHFIYAVWDRLAASGNGPTYFARSVDGGQSWEPARAIYDPGPINQTIGNILVVLPNGMLVTVFTEIDNAPDGTFSAHLGVVRSSDNGLTWSAPTRIADELTVGTRDAATGAPVRDGSLVPSIAVGSGGTLFAVWQDARFSNGARDAIALSQSTDGGLSWSVPARVNADPDVAAFAPVVHVRADGVVGVTYYDFRDDTGSASLLTDYWLARSTDATAWIESQIAGPFDLALAPLTNSPGTGGYFLGDYQGLASAGTTFIPLFVQTSGTDPSNRTDVFAAPAVSASAGASAIAAAQRALPAAKSAAVPQAGITARVSENIAGAMQRRVPGWREPAPGNTAPNR